MAILFDFNGTMFLDEAFQEKSWRQFLKEKTGRAVTDEEFQVYVHGRNNAVTLEHFLQRPLSHKELETLGEEKEVIYRKLCLESKAFHLTPGLETFLDGLKQEEIPINIATASGRKNVDFFFTHLKLDRWFDPDRVIYDDGTIPGKPAPDLYLRAAEKIGVPIGNCYVFEDSRSGIEAAIRAGARGVIKVDPAGRPETRPEVLQVIADYDGLDPERFH